MENILILFSTFFTFQASQSHRIYFVIAGFEVEYPRPGLILFTRKASHLQQSQLVNNPTGAFCQDSLPKPSYKLNVFNSTQGVGPTSKYSPFEFDEFDGMGAYVQGADKIPDLLFQDIDLCDFFKA